MGPYFVFVMRNEVELHDFPTLLEAQAFYYGMREMIRRTREGRKTYDVADVQWMTCDMDDCMSLAGGIGHYTIYTDEVTWNEAKIKRFIYDFVSGEEI